MKFLVTGSTGLIGTQIVKDLSDSSHEIYSGYHDSKPIHGIPIHIDLLNLEKISEIMGDIKPDIIIHLAAIRDVDFCEREKEMSTRINSIATKVLAEEAAKNKSFFVYVSTDYVFDGKNGMKKESDSPNPISHYGVSKLEGENFIKKLNLDWSIVRTSTPFGFHSTQKSFPLWVIENLSQNKNIKVVTDQYTSPTYVPNFSKMLIELVEKKFKGIIHLAGATRISRYDLAELVAEKLGFDKKLLMSEKMDNINWKAQRPQDSSLDVSYASSILNTKPQKIEESISLFVNELETFSK
ncbi:MAG: dTDP-4-dehydrorhamnose reductase [Nitrosotalea sp.]